jgi:hypothetical protein
MQMIYSTIYLLFYGCCCCYMEPSRALLLPCLVTAVACAHSTATPYSSPLLLLQLMHDL